MYEHKGNRYNLKQVVLAVKASKPEHTSITKQADDCKVSTCSDPVFRSNSVTLPWTETSRSLKLSKDWNMEKAWMGFGFYDSQHLNAKDLSITPWI